VAYAIVGWILIEVSSTVLPLFEAPDWIAQVFAFFVILGFPLALILSWAYEITPEGIKADADVPRDSITPVTGQRLNYVIVGLLVLAVGVMFVDNYVLEEESQAVSRSDDRRSIAVLPLDNLSPDPENAFFADGIHGDLLTQLSKIGSLKVISRTSVMEYRDSPKNMREIGQELGVATILEGDVRRAGGTVRINVQLIDAETDEHLWAETYDRELTAENVFAIQADIATNIAAALKAELLPAERQRIEQVSTDSTEALALYYQARETWNSSFAGLGEARHLAIEAYLNQALSFDPNFADVYAWKARLFSSDEDQINETLVVENAQKALDLDPNLGLAYAALGRYYRFTWRGAEARESFELALERSPNDEVVLQDYSAFLILVDQHDDAIRLARHIVELAPTSARALSFLGAVQQLAGNHDLAADVLRRAVELDPASPGAHLALARTEVARGNMATALDQLRIAEQYRFQSGGSGGPMNFANTYRLAGSLADALRIANERDYDEIVLGEGTGVPYDMAIGNYERALEDIRIRVEERHPQSVPYWLVRANVWRDPVLETAEWVEIRNRMGFPDL